MSAKKATKRAPRRRTRFNTFYAYWSKKERAIIYHHPTRAADGGLVSFVFENESGFCWSGADGYEKTFLKELEKRGYDLTTLRFSIMKKAPVEEGGAA
jgi:hypothetical protein